ncbi:MAG: hypothetical protein P8X68_08890 [Desulfobacterales bacterium]
MQIRYLSLFIVITVCFSAPVRAQQTPEEILDAVIKINQETRIRDIGVQSADRYQFLKVSRQP